MKIRERKCPQQLILLPDVEGLFNETKALYEHITGRVFFKKEFGNWAIEKGLLQIREELKNVGK